MNTKKWNERVFFKGFFSQTCLDCSIAGVVGVMCVVMLWKRERERERMRIGSEAEDPMQATNATTTQHNTSQPPFSLNSIYNLQEGESRGRLLLSLTL